MQPISAGDRREDGGRHPRWPGCEQEAERPQGGDPLGETERARHQLAERLAPTRAADLLLEPALSVRAFELGERSAQRTGDGVASEDHADPVSGDYPEHHVV